MSAYECENITIDAAIIRSRLKLFSRPNATPTSVGMAAPLERGADVRAIPSITLASSLAAVVSRPAEILSAAAAIAQRAVSRYLRSLTLGVLPIAIGG